MTLQTDVPRIANLTLDPNEASGLLRVNDDSVLGRYGWDHAFWSVLDEVDIHEVIVLIGHEDGKPLDDGWSIQKAQAERRGGIGRMRDAESLSHSDGWVYIVGSHHGGKDGPIRRTHQWVARFREQVADGSADEPPQLDLQVADTAFRLHRTVNDGLRSSGLDLIAMGPLTR